MEGLVLAWQGAGLPAEQDRAALKGVTFCRDGWRGTDCYKQKGKLSRLTSDCTEDCEAASHPGEVTGLTHLWGPLCAHLENRVAPPLAACPSLRRLG